MISTIINRLMIDFETQFSTQRSATHAKISSSELMLNIHIMYSIHMIYGCMFKCDLACKILFSNFYICT